MVMQVIGGPETCGMRRHDDFYFQDGNIILVAEQTCFRVHMSMLTRHSDAFREIISVPNPANTLTMDGCSVVALQDKPEDIWHLLMAVYDGLYFTDGNPVAFPSLSGVLRLSTKYVFQYLRQRALARLRMDWPLTLAEWDIREKRATTSDGLYNPSNVRTNPILIVNLAQELCLPWILPAAFYDLSRYTPTQILGGSPEIDGCPKAYLKAVDLVNLFQGKKAGKDFIRSFVATELEDRGTTPWCRNSQENRNEICRDAFRLILFETMRGMAGLTPGRGCDPLFTLECIVEMQKRESASDFVEKATARGCEICRADLRRATERARQEVWESIPKWFGLDEKITEHGEEV